MREILLLLLAGFVIYVYAGYPLMMWAWSRALHRAPTLAAPRANASFSIILAVYNEEQSIARRLHELSDPLAVAGLDAEIIVVSDGSTDATVEFARAALTPHTRVLELPHLGKANALSHAAAIARNEILVFTDARQKWAPEAVKHLLANFADPEVGAVSGELRIQSAPGVLAGVGLYWRYESWLRRTESRVHSTIGVSGPICAVRRKLFRAIPAGTILDDVYWPLTIAMQGYRVLYDERAVAFDRWPQTALGELRRKIRTSSGNFQLCTKLPSALLPWRNPIWFQFVSHKLLRLAVPWALLAILALSIVVPWLFWAQVAAYSVAMIVRPARAFLLLNFAAWAAFWVWISGRAERSWVKVKFIPTKNFAVKTRHRNVHRWLLPYALQAHKRRQPKHDDPVHLLLCIADHFEPSNGNVSREVAMQRVDQWVENYPQLFADFSDSDGRPPRHTFFYPLELYQREEIDELASLCRLGFGEVEVHLHHEDETAESLRERLLDYKQMLASRHGLLARDRQSGEIKYGFVHGNFALANSRPDGRYCGVHNELDILRETGCYADFTMPSVPDPTLCRRINSIYYASGKCLNRGPDAGAAPAPADSLLLVQGPLALDWGRRKWGIVPCIENGCLQGNQAPSIERLKLWLRARVQVATRPDWFFVKLHTHGAPEANQRVLLGEPMVNFHRGLAQLARDNRNFHYHYVTAREMHNLAGAAQAGWKGSVDAARDMGLIWPNESGTRRGDGMAIAAAS